MSTKKKSEKDAKPSTAAHDPAVVKTPSETKRELTDDEIASVAAGLNFTKIEYN
jgi:hypothetical protein